MCIHTITHWYWKIWRWWEIMHSLHKDKPFHPFHTQWTCQSQDSRLKVSPLAVSGRTFWVCGWITSMPLSFLDSAWYHQMHMKMSLGAISPLSNWPSFNTTKHSPHFTTYHPPIHPFIPSTHPDLCHQPSSTHQPSPSQPSKSISISKHPISSCLNMLKPSNPDVFPPRFLGPPGPQKSHRIPCGQIHGALVCLFLAMVSCPACWNFAKARDLGFAFIAFVLASWHRGLFPMLPVFRMYSPIPRKILIWFPDSHDIRIPNTPGQIPLSQRPLLTEFFSVWQCNVPSVPWVPWAATLTPSRAIRGSNAARTRSKTDLANSGALQNPVPRSHGSWFLHVPTWQFCCS